jgi:hypothetical protein
MIWKRGGLFTFGSISSLQKTNDFADHDFAIPLQKMILSPNDSVLIF